jgi:Lipid A core - O-antigen ligase and related enzymes
MTDIDRTKDEADSRFSSVIFVALCAMSLLAVIAYGAVDPMATGILSIASLVCVSLWAADAWRTGVLKFSSEKIQLPIIALIFVGAIQLLPLAQVSLASQTLGLHASSALSLDPYATQMFIIRLVLLVVFLAAALTFIDTKERVKKTLIILISFGAIMGFFGVLQKLGDPGAIYGLRETPQAIPFGSYVNQHHFASLMVMLSAPVIGLLSAGSLKRDYLPLLWIAAGMMAIAVVFSGSRGGLLSYVAMVGVVLLISARHPTTVKSEGDDKFGNILPRISKFAGIAIITLALGGVIVFLGAGDSLLRGVGLSATDDVSSGRFHFWNTAVQIFLAHPILGVGLDAFGVAFSQFDTRNGLFRVEQAHNEYLQMLADAGIAGLACVATFIYFF